MEEQLGVPREEEGETMSTDAAWPMASAEASGGTTMSPELITQLLQATGTGGGGVALSQCETCGNGNGGGPTTEPSMAGPAALDMGGTDETQFVFALGQVAPRAPTLAVERELARVTGQSAVESLTDREAAQRVLGDRGNRYLTREMCWVMTIEGIETYILEPRDPQDVELLTDALRPNPRATDVDVVVGERIGLASPERCNGLVVPVVIFDQIWSFDMDSFREQVPKPADAKAAQFEQTVDEVFSRVLQIADNAGATDEHRALNFIAVTYPAIYERTAASFNQNHSLTRVEARPSRLSGARKIVDVVFSYTNRETDVTEQWFVRVDVEEKFPFLVSKLAPFYDR
jgi:hypothetical protein